MTRSALIATTLLEGMHVLDAEYARAEPPESPIGRLIASSRCPGNYWVQTAGRGPEVGDDSETVDSRTG